MLSLDKNYSELDISGVYELQAKGWTGRDVKIAIVDVEFNDKDGHGDIVLETLRLIAPEAYISRYTNPQDVPMDVHIINMSTTGAELYEPYYKKWADAGILVCVSCGNDGAKGEAFAGSLPYVISVGAAHYNDYKKEYDLAYYSSWGKGEIDVVSFSRIFINNKYYQGTSFSCPFFVGQMALLYEYYYNQNGKMPNAEFIKSILPALCEPMEEGKLKTGYGLFKLPKGLERKKNKKHSLIMIEGDEYCYRGAQKFKLPQPLQIINGHSMVPLREPFELLGHYVDYEEVTTDDKVKKIIIIR